MSIPTVNLLLASDLHLEVGNYSLRAQIERLRHDGRRIDAVILAGDIMDVAGGDPVAYAADQVPADLPAIFVPGNHDFYGGRYGNLVNRWRASAAGSHVRVLMEDSMTVPSPDGGEVVVLGTPLWSNLQSQGPVAEAQLRRTVHRQISDFSCMFASDGSSWTVQNLLEEFEKGRLFLKRELSDAMLSDGRRRVVVTHFGPHRESIVPEWRNEDVSAYFCNHLPELVERADLWLHGHTHHALEYQVGRDDALGKVICHPRGYAMGTEKEMALSYVPRLLEVPVARQPWEA